MDKIIFFTQARTGLESVVEKSSDCLSTTSFIKDDQAGVQYFSMTNCLKNLISTLKPLKYNFKKRFGILTNTNIDNLYFL